MFKPRKPKYSREARNYIYKGVEVDSEPHLLAYDIKLPFEIYINLNDMKPDLAQQILQSLDVISTMKQIKDFNLEAFKADFEQFFKDNRWL